MAITLDGTNGITSPLFDGPLDAADLTGDVAAARITGALNATGSAPIYACRAWVNFNGTGTVAIRASGNVSSITDGGVGIYTVNFATAMPDANYATLLSTYNYGSYADNPFVYTGQTASAVRVDNATTSGAYTDTTYVYVAIFR